MSVPHPEPLQDPAHRGSLHIGGRVVEKIAVHAARGANTDAAPDTALRAPRAGVKMQNDHATLHLDLDAPYPGKVSDLAREVRRRVRADVERLTGLPVVRIDVVVSHLTRGGKGRKRVN